MDRESFLDTLREQYADEIHEAYVACNHGEAVDYDQLNTSLGRIMKTARVDGLSEADFAELVQSTIPEHSEKIQVISPFRAKAA